MKVIDFSKHKFSPHAVGKLLTEPKLKRDKEAGLLGQTTKTYLDELFIKLLFGRKKDFSSKEIIKGLMNEEDSLGLVQEVKSITSKGNVFLGKNKKTIENDYLIGTPDYIGNDYILDVKTSWDMFTFMSSSITKLYEWQIKAYCLIEGLEKGELSYCLTNTPSHLIASEIRKVYYSMGVIDEENDKDYIEAVKQIEYNHNFNDIPSILKVKTFNVNLEPGDEEFLYGKIIKSRNYLIEKQENYINKLEKLL